MATVHWLGAGLSSGPGIRRLASMDQHALVLWNRTLSKAEAALSAVAGSASARTLDWQKLESAIEPGDLLVSMLPAAMHPQVAALCLSRKAHFVSSSYLSPEMLAMSASAADSGLSFVNEVGLDPGIDHLMARALMTEYRNSDCFDKTNGHYFRSYCGGLSKEPNDFRYKFSWSPLGVLKALTNTAIWRADGKVQTTDRPWKSLTEYTLSLPSGDETFQAYPNRDSLPYQSEYGFGEDWNVQEFIRGTLRLNGWAEAWKDIFELVDSAEGDDRQQKLEAKSDELWSEHRLQDGEQDRVILSVELEVQRPGSDQATLTAWHQRYVMDSVGDERGTAMARLVSLTVSLAVDSVLRGELPPGVSAAPDDMKIVEHWFAQLTQMGESIERVTLAPSPVGA